MSDRLGAIVFLFLAVGFWVYRLDVHKICHEYENMKSLSNWKIRLLVGLIAGLLIVFVDNFAFQGEVSPIIIVILLLISTVALGAIWKWQAWAAVVIIWICVPLAHVVKHLLGLPDTLYPNNYTSIFMLAVFTFVVSAIGFLSGTLINRISKHTQKA